MKQPPHQTARYYEPWAAYVATERALRAIPQARGVYKRAWSRKLEEGGQLAVCYDWLRFEREEGRWVVRFSSLPGAWGGWLECKGSWIEMLGRLPQSIDFISAAVLIQPT